MDIQHILEITCIICLKSPCEAARRSVTKLDDEPAYATIECAECTAKRTNPPREELFWLHDAPTSNLAKLLKEHRH